MSPDMNQRKAKRFVSFAHVMIQGRGLYGYVTNVSETGIKILVNTKAMDLENEAVYQLEIRAPEAGIPSFVCNAKIKWIRQIDMFHFEAGFELAVSASSPEYGPYAKLIENYADTRD